MRHAKYILTSKSVPNIKQWYSILRVNICVFELSVKQAQVFRATYCIICDIYNLSVIFVIIS